MLIKNIVNYRTLWRWRNKSSLDSNCSPSVRAFFVTLLIAGFGQIVIARLLRSIGVSIANLGIPFFVQIAEVLREKRRPWQTKVLIFCRTALTFQFCERDGIICSCYGFLRSDHHHRNSSLLNDLCCYRTQKMI